MIERRRQLVQFTHLHTHTPEGSLLDGFMRMDKAIDKAKSLGMDALGVSEHGTMSSHQEFYEKMTAADLHPIFGMEAYQTVNKSYRKADFDGVDYIEDANGYLIFGLYNREDVNQDDWLEVSEITPQKDRKKLTRLAKDEGALLYKEVEETLPPGELMPKSKAGITRRANALLKEYDKRNIALYVKADTSKQRYFEWFPRIGHLLLIAKNNNGYQNLLKLNAIGFKDGFYGKPRIDYDDLKAYGEDLVATTACLGSFTSQLIMQGRDQEAKEEILKLTEFFDEVYLEIQPSRQEDQHIVNNKLIEFSKELDLPLIATSDVHMVDKDELELHAQITNISRGSSKDASALDSDISVYDSAYMMTPQEMIDHGIPEEAMQNAYDLSHRCQVDFMANKELKFPEYSVPEGYTFDSYLRKRANEGLFEFLLNSDDVDDYDKYQERLDYELGVISQKGYSAYFLIVEDYMTWARDQDIMVGPGRGSAAGSLTSFLLKIIYVNPLKHGLFFGRFLNPERNSLPDIDSDFDYLRREEVINYLRDKYGRNHVSKIGTYTTMSSKMALKDAGRALDYDYDYTNTLTKYIPMDNGKNMPLEEAVQEIPEIKQAKEKFPDLFELAMDLQGIPRSASQHASGILITPQELDRSLPLQVAKDEVVTQYDGEILEDIGYLKVLN